MYPYAPDLKECGSMAAVATLRGGQLDVIAPGVQRLVALNAGYLTGPGTNSYLFGNERFLILDPGPLEEPHIERLLQQTAGRIDGVLVTHTHRDHSPAAAVIAARTGAPLLGKAAPPTGPQDSSFVPARELQDGEVIEFDAGRLRVLHTPGHASNHLCYLLEGSGLLFTGDHLMQGSTVVIAPPDGDMMLYLASLQRLLSEPVQALAPGHGLVIDDAPAEIVRIIAHRLQREAKVMQRLAAMSPASLLALLPRVYDDVDQRLHVLARASLLAHLLKLEREGRVRRSGEDVWAVSH
jgi:glyoxylase-like metal-dependent hydrolase (beta-lactamase superfamily II)